MSQALCYREYHKKVRKKESLLSCKLAAAVHVTSGPHPLLDAFRARNVAEVFQPLSKVL